MLLCIYLNIKSISDCDKNILTLYMGHCEPLPYNNWKCAIPFIITSQNIAVGNIYC